MKNARRWVKPLLWLHFIVCLVWLSLCHPSDHMPSDWMLHVFAWSVMAVQFTWGFTVGLLVGPSRKRRSLLWWSLLTIFMPFYVLSPITQMILFFCGPLVALVYFAIFTMILACETYCGVLMGARLHAESNED